MSRRVFLAMLLVAVSIMVGLGAAGKRPLISDDLYRLHSVTDPRLSPDGKLVAFVVNGVDRTQNRRTSSIWMAAADGSSAPWQFTVAQSSRSPQWSPDGRVVAFISARSEPDAPASAPAPRPQIYLQRVGGGEARRLTSLAEGVDAFAWSPDGTRIACIGKVAAPAGTPESAGRSDVRHYLHSSYKADGVGYDDGRRGQVWVADVKTGVATPLTSSRTQSASDGPEWSPDGTRLAFVAQRSETDSEENGDVWVVPAAGGDPVKVSDTGFRVAGPRWSPDGRQIAYIAARDWEAIPKIHMAPASGGRSAVLAGDLTFVTELTWSADGKCLYATVPLKGEEHLVRVDVASGRMAPVTSGARTVRRPDISEAAGLMAYVAGGVTRPDEVFVANVSGGGERQISRVNDSLVSSVELADVERMTYKSVDGWEVDGFLMKPAGWRPDRSYPMVLTIHGGPNGMYGVHWNPDFQVLAGAGYAVFFTNPRGSSGYGERFQRGVANEWGGKACDDIMAGVDAVLAKHPWIDRNRLGVTGLSYGGFMTNWIVGQTDRFKAAVSLAGISDFVSVEGTRDGFYGHAKDFGGDLFGSFDTYWRYSPIRYANRVKTPVLIVHGESDLRVPMLQGEEMFRALRHFGVTSELVIVPREPHNLRREPQHQVEVMDWTLYWFRRFLHGDGNAARPNGR